MTPLPVFTDCCEANMRPAMCVPATMLPTTRTSKEGNGESLSASDGPPLTMSAHVIVLAGSWMTMLHGTTIFVLLIVTVPPRFCALLTSGHALLSALTVASWMKPVSSKPWMSAVFVLNTGSGSVGVMNGDTAPAGGFAVPPPFAYATTAPATRMARPSTIVSVRRVHRGVRFLRSIASVPRSGRIGLKTFVGGGRVREAPSRTAACGGTKRRPRPGGAPRRGPAVHARRRAEFGAARSNRGRTGAFLNAHRLSRAAGAEDCGAVIRP